MKAATIRDYGADIEISEIDAPEPKDDQVRVKVYAAALNPIDSVLRAGQMKDAMPLSFPHVMGYDLSGVVTEIGKDVSSVKAGDAVLARPNQNDAGSLAEYAVVRETELAVKPDSMTHEVAASVPLAGLTAWQALFDKAGLKAGQKVLIHAGSGGVGTLAIQIAKHAGAFVATTCSARNAELVRDLGADLVIDYKKERFEDEISDYDVVFDMMGGEVLNRSFGVLKKGGVLVSIKGQDTEENAAKHGARFEWFLMDPNGAQLDELAALIDQGAVKPVIGATFDFTEVQAAYDELDNGKSVGKVVVIIA